MTDCTDLMRPEVCENLPYRIYIPENAGPARRYPLVLYLHGLGECGSDNRLQTSKNSVMQTLLEPENRAAYPCVVLAPQCPEGEWWSGLVQVLMGLLEHAKVAYSIDANRIYITGLSMGGFGAWAMLTQYPDTFAAAVPICGGGDPDDARLFAHVPVWAFHGAQDTTVRPEGSREIVKAMVHAGARGVRYTEYPDAAHNSWDRAYREPGLFPWMFAQRRPS